MDEAQKILSRNTEMVAMRELGHTYDEIGSKHGLSKERVRQIITELRPDLIGEPPVRPHQDSQDQRPPTLVRQIRRKLGLTGGQLARVLGLNQRTVVRYEQNPSMEGARPMPGPLYLLMRSVLDSKKPTIADLHNALPKDIMMLCEWHYRGKKPDLKVARE